MTDTSDKIDLITYVHFSGPGVDAFNNRKETGSKRKVTEREMRASYPRRKAAKRYNIITRD